MNQVATILTRAEYLGISESRWFSKASQAPGFLVFDQNDIVHVTHALRSSQRLLGSCLRL